MSSTDIIIKTPDTSEMEKQSFNVVEAANKLQIVDNETLLEAGEKFNQASRVIKNIEAEIAPSKRAADEAHDNICALEKRMIGPWKQTKLVLGEKIAAWNKAIADQRAKEMAEARAQAEKDAENKRLAEAQKAIDKGDDQKAKALLYDTPPPITAAIKPVTPPPPKIDGYSERKTWDYEVEDVGALPMEYLMPNDVALGKVVRAMGERANIPGIRVFPKTISGSR